MNNVQNHADKNQKNQIRAVGYQPSRRNRGGKAKFHLVDNRPEAKQLERLQEMSNNSPQSKKAAQLQAMINNSHRIVAEQQPDEAWHLLQQNQGGLKPTMQMKEQVKLNDDEGLEKDAEVMGAKALTTGQELNAHEVRQVVQRNNGMVERSPEPQENLLQNHESTTPFERMAFQTPARNYPPIQMVNGHGRPDTILGEQGNHTTAWAAVWRGISGVIGRFQGQGDTHRAAYIGTLDMVRTLPGTDEQHMRMLTAEEEENYQETLQEAIDFSEDVPNHSYMTGHAVAIINRGKRLLEALANLNPLATTFRGDTGGGEGHAIRELNVLDDTPDDERDETFAGRALSAIGRLFDFRHTSDAIELEDEAEGEERGTYLPGVLRDGDGEVDTESTRDALAGRHTGYIASAWQSVVNFVTENRITEYITQGLAEGPQDEAYDPNEGE